MFHNGMQNAVFERENPPSFSHLKDDESERIGHLVDQHCKMPMKRKEATSIYIIQELYSQKIRI